jgi:glutaredoxin 1
MNVTIIGRKSCEWCRKARQLCKANKIDYQYKDLDAPANAQLRRWFEIEDIKTVPQIFVIEDGSSELVGGYEDFERYLSSRS